MVKPTVERATWSGPAVVMAVLWSGLACSSHEAINIGGDDGDQTGPNLVSLPCNAITYVPVDPYNRFNVYDAKKSLTLASPIENVVGVASDETGLWLLSAIWNTGNVRLIHHDLTTGLSTDPLWVYGLFDKPGTGAAALEIDSRFFWVGLSGNDTSIVRIDRSTGEVMRLPGVEPGGASDFAWLGHDLLVTTVAGTIDVFTPLPSWTRRQFVDQPDAPREFNVATCGDTVVIGGGENGAGLVGPDPEKSGAAGAIGSEAGLSGPSTTGPICFYGNQLVVATTAGLEFYDLSLRPSP